MLGVVFISLPMMSPGTMGRPFVARIMQGSSWIGDDGWLVRGREGFRTEASPHFDFRPQMASIDLLVVHGISLPEGAYGGEAVTDLFMGRLDCAAHPSFQGLKGLRVSAHFFIERDGAINQYVSCLNRAWHAGQSSFRGRQQCNDFSIGVEIEGCDQDGYEPAQLEQLATLCEAVSCAYPSCRDLAAHSDISPGRKTDPGPFFDWGFLHQLLEGRGVLMRRELQ